jgi:signal transduction histidine kinase
METATNVNFFIILSSFISIVFLIAVGVVLLNLQFQKNMFRQQLANEELKSKHQLELLQSSIAVQEGERKRIAENLHDELGAILSISRMRMMQLEGELTSNQHVGNLAEIRSYIENSLASMRRISHELIPPQLEQFGLVSTLESISYDLSKTKEIIVTVTTNHDLQAFSWPLQLGLYRVVMELINNTIKHAHATEIHIDLAVNELTLQCLYTDNGIGLKTNTTPNGLGFKNIESRVKALEGVFTIGESNKPGFNVCIQIPIK